MKTFTLPESLTLKNLWETFQGQFEPDLVEGTIMYRDYQRIFYSGVLAGERIIYEASKKPGFPTSQIIAFNTTEFVKFIEQEIKLARES